MSRRHARRPAPVRTQRGLSLIEVLMAVLVMGLGLLGLAMLQATNLRLSQSANQRTVATNLSSDLLDDIRSNRLLAAKYGGTYNASSAAANASCARINKLTPDDRKAAFTCRMREALGASAVATVTVNPDKTVRIVITWDDDKRWNALGSGTEFRMESAL
ncbi:type IV pilus modification protein PilV [Lysobacter sp. BMK333-48F3]|uniref:type IV pilus modification protein PilV n=1 Tax=Lysobacter sp. BMK333-48F3 TaxID=2867962 RepID=UPI001C8BAADF|nr:type IV pilus modification protein PilV [Lysobacter sp. BMK333-48F3]MBX9403991.1 type IV pilus modification protein PilV [Lysobacter sp. BMK333-48F3]